MKDSIDRSRKEILQSYFEDGAETAIEFYGEEAVIDAFKEDDKEVN